MDTDKTDTEPDPKETGSEGSGPEGSGTKQAQTDQPNAGPNAPVEINGPKGPEPTRYGDWEQKGRCSDF
ncbi:MAG: DUF1674 domain-containing protein [Candidatus Puniceispirillaceae bacterium]